LGHRGRRKDATSETAMRPIPTKILTPSRATRSKGHVAPDPPSDEPYGTPARVRKVACEELFAGPSHSALPELVMVEPTQAQPVAPEFSASLSGNFIVL